MAFIDIQNSSLWLDIKKIVTSDKKPIKFTYKGMIHTSKEDFPILKIISIDTVRDYANNIGDRVHIEFMLPMGDYITRLYPYRGNLELTIKKIQLQENSGDKEKGVDILTEKFKAVFMPDHNQIVNATDIEMIDHNSLNNAQLVTVKLDLLNRSLEPLRIKKVRGIFRNITPKNLIHSVLYNESTMVRIDGKPSVDAIDIIEPDNNDVRKHFVIPDGVNLSGLPTYIQQDQGGLYNAGVGTYLQNFKNKKTWFVYPLLNFKKFVKNQGKAIFYSVPQGRLPSIDRTYNVDGDTTYIAVTDQRTYDDSAETDFMNKGVGFRMADARPFMKKPVNITKDGPVANRVQLVHEVALASREDGLNYAPVSPRGISSNPYMEYSKILLRDSSRVSIIWENSNPDLIYPGMPCRYSFISNNDIITLDGVIVFVHALIGLSGSGLMANIYRTQTMITILISGYKHKPALSKNQPYGDF